MRVAARYVQIVCRVFAAALTGGASSASALVVNDFAGRGCGSGAPAISMATAPTSLAYLDGMLYETDDRCHGIHVIHPDGRAERVVGAGIRGNTNGPPATARLTSPNDVTRGGDGLLYWTEGGKLVKRIGSNGQVEVVAELVAAGSSLPFGIAADARRVYIAAQNANRVLAIRTPCNAPCSAEPFAGNGMIGFGGDGGPALDAKLNQPRDVAVLNGNIFIADVQNFRVRRVGSDNVITTVAGSGFGFAGDGGPAVQAKFRAPVAIALSPDGVLYVADSESHRIRRVGVDGIINTVAGTGEGQSVAMPAIAPEDVGVGYNPLKLKISKPSSVAVDAQGGVYIGSREDGVVLRLSAGEPNEPTPSPSPAPPERCDVTGDGSVDGLDAALIMDFVLGARGLCATGPSGVRRCDLSGDGRVTGADAARVLQFISGMSPTCP
ncbi:MAG: dockerin type I domain-containing protein [Candidatus Binatia bacterium]